MEDEKLFAPEPPETVFRSLNNRVLAAVLNDVVYSANPPSVLYFTLLSKKFKSFWVAALWIVNYFIKLVNSPRPSYSL